MKKRVLAVLLACLTAFGLGACGAGGKADSSGDGAEAESEPENGTEDGGETTEGGEEAELTVFAAASLTETLTEISELYREEHPEVTLVFNFDSSGTLKTQIQEGAACDLFLSAGQLQMDQMDAGADPEVNTEGLDLVLEGSRVDILENKVVLCVSESTDVQLETFDTWRRLSATARSCWAWATAMCLWGSTHRRSWSTTGSAKKNWPRPEGSPTGAT